MLCFLCFICSLRLKKKSQSVDITSQGYSGTLVKDNQHSPINRLVPSVARTTVSGEEEGRNATNSQRAGSPRHSDLKRFYTMGNSMSPGHVKGCVRSRLCGQSQAQRLACCLKDMAA